MISDHSLPNKGSPARAIAKHPIKAKHQMPTLSLYEIRQRCRRYARQFSYSEVLFNRIPAYIFQYLCSPNPLEVVRASFDQMDIINIFMLINGISADLMMAFYAAANQNLENVLMIHEYLLRMWQMYRQATPENLCGIFGTFFSYHLETRTLRRVDMSIVYRHRNLSQEPHFVPNQPNWRRAREVRRLYRLGQYRVNDIYDIAELRMAWYGGMRQRHGRHNESTQ